jgi:TM2 domain-containing membrane protein YozV
LVGGLGIHKFVLGYTTEGLIMLLVTVLTCGIGGIIFTPIGLVEGILYLVKSDEEFVKTYIQNKRGWF